MDSSVLIQSLAVVSISVVFTYGFLSWLRTKYPVKVQCWFCHTFTSVHSEEKNCWTCASCDQYNGFNKDGGYNRAIPQQYDERLNVRMSTTGRRTHYWKPGAALCPTCNYNQELKVKQLAGFKPLCEANYNREVEHFRVQLEESYRLCKRCEETLSSVLAKEKISFQGARRLLQSTRKLVFKSSILLCVGGLLGALTAASLSKVAGTWPSKWWDPTVLCQPFTAVGVFLLTAQCFQQRSIWSGVLWLVWFTMALTPHALQGQKHSHIALIQMTICISVFLSSAIILFRRKRMEYKLKKREEVRKERRKKQEAASFWTSQSSFSPSHGYRKAPSEQFGRRKVVKPVAKRGEELDLSGLTLGKRRERKGLLRPSALSAWDDSHSRSSSRSSGEQWTESWTSNPWQARSQSPWQTGPQSAWQTPRPQSPWQAPSWTSTPITRWHSSPSSNYEYTPPPAPASDPSFLSTIPALVLALSNIALVVFIFTRN